MEIDRRRTTSINTVSFTFLLPFISIAYLAIQNLMSMSTH